MASSFHDIYYFCLYDRQGRLDEGDGGDTRHYSVTVSDLRDLLDYVSSELTPHEISISYIALVRHTRGYWGPDICECFLQFAETPEGLRLVYDRSGDSIFEYPKRVHKVLEKFWQEKPVFDRQAWGM